MSRNKTVLVISDRQEQFDLTATLLRKNGYSVLFESNVSQSLTVAEAELPKLIISELAVPNIDGLELCMRVRKGTSLRSTPILLVGDLSKQSLIVADSLRCGAADYLQKPIDHLKLFELCCEVVGFEEHDPPAHQDENVFSSMVEKNYTLDQALKNNILRNALFDNIPIGLALFSSSGRLLESNPALLRLLDYSATELRGMLLAEFIFPETGEIDKLALVELMNGKRWHYQCENGYLTPTGDRIWGKLTIVAIPEQDNESGFLIGIFDDPTNQVSLYAAPLNVDRPFEFQNRHPRILDFNRWKIDKDLISKN